MDSLPPIHDAVRFWHRTEAATLTSCLDFRRKQLPGWSLTWLRRAAPIIMTGELKEVALKHAVKETVFPDSQASVLRAVELFCRFAAKHQWKGKSLSPRAFELVGGSAIKIEPIGRYFSTHTDSEWVVALQPRQDDPPSEEQFCMWRSAIYYLFCGDRDDAMIIDLSMNPVSKKRELHEITARKHPLVDKRELEERLELVASCYRRAIEIVPDRPPPRRGPKPDDPSFDF